MNNEPYISLGRLTKSYQEGSVTRAVLRDLSLDMDEGEMIVLLGRSGSGKSTLLNLISGIDKPDTGKVLIGGTNLVSLNEKQRTLFRRNNIGFVFQSFNLISTLTVHENVLLPLKLKNNADREAFRKATRFLEEVGLGDRGDSYPDRLSGGERQRVAIARALANEPLLILADEPTGNLDYKTGQLILKMLHTLVRKNNRTIIIATHDRDICQIADRVFNLQDGVLNEVKNHAEITGE